MWGGCGGDWGVGGKGLSSFVLSCVCCLVLSYSSSSSSSPPPFCCSVVLSVIMVETRLLYSS